MREATSMTMHWRSAAQPIRFGCLSMEIRHERKPRINDIDGCIDYDYQEGD